MAFPLSLMRLYHRKPSSRRRRSSSHGARSGSAFPRAVGLASYIAVLEGLYLLTGREIWFRISGFWTRIFAVSFGMGVVSGVIMPFQFGTNWSRFIDATADVISPLLAYEGLLAFFLESSFLGVLLFGRRLVPAWAHFLAAFMVAFGTLLSSFWI